MSLFSGSPGSPSSPSRSISKVASTGGSFSVYQITEHTDNDTFWKDPRRAEKIDELKEQWARDTARAVAEAVDAKEAEMMAAFLDKWLQSLVQKIERSFSNLLKLRP